MWSLHFEAQIAAELKAAKIIAVLDRAAALPPLAGCVVMVLVLMRGQWSRVWIIARTLYRQLHAAYVKRALHERKIECPVKL